MKMLKVVFIFLFVFLSRVSAEGISVDLGFTEGGSTIAKILHVLFAFSAIGLAPYVVMTVTSFTRIMVVLAFLRNALGLQQSPPNLVMVAFALFLTGFIMEPVFLKSYNDGIEPLMAERISEKEAWPLIVEPFKGFITKNTRAKDILLFQDLAQKDVAEKDEVTSLRVMVPAFIISELRRAFEIGFLIYLPFLIIDMLVASILMSMGMMMLPPVVISLPFKVVFFVVVDGWHLLAGTLVKSFIN
jgi:flagellar biosynthesis protein FliP